MYQIHRAVVKPGSTYYPDRVCSELFQYVEGHCDLDLQTTDLKINIDHWRLCN